MLSPFPLVAVSPTPDPISAFLGLIITVGFFGAIISFLLGMLKHLRKKNAARPIVPVQNISDTPPPAIVPPPVPTIQSPKTLADLSWQEFELLIGELNRRQGYAVEMCAGDGADGGIDLRLQKEGKTTLVQCKHWKTYKVGVSPVRELFGVMVSEKADAAIFVTTGKFTQDAKAFAAGKPLELIDGTELNRRLEESKWSGAGKLLDVQSWVNTFANSATITNPTCPFCHSPMILRQAKQSGSKFWGCSTYPKCRGKRNVRAGLMAV